jgi:hypothetical protein
MKLSTLYPKCHLKLHRRTIRMGGFYIVVEVIKFKKHSVDIANVHHGRSTSEDVIAYMSTDVGSYIVESTK